MSWIGKMESMIFTVRDAAASHWELYYIFPMMIAIAAIMLATKIPSLNETMRRKARIMRYCHDCPFVDMHSETCSIQADAGEKCGLIDKTAGMTFEVTKVE